MEKYAKLREYFKRNKNVYGKPITLESLEKILEIDRLPKSLYTNENYWNNSNVGIGKILNELGIKAKLTKATVEFEINRK